MMSANGWQWWLFTLLIHSTLFVAAAAIFSRCIAAQQTKLIAWSWRLAIIGAFITTPLAMLLPGELSIVSLFPADDTNINAPSGATLEELALLRQRNNRDLSDLNYNEILARRGESPLETAWRESTETLSDNGPQILAWSIVSLIAGGLVVGLIKLARGYSKLSRDLANCTKVTDPQLLACIQNVSQTLGIRHSVEALMMSRAGSPMAVGFVRHALVLPPSDWLARLDGDEQIGMIAHELAHLRNRDPLWSIAAHLICHALWFQPLYWLAARQMRIAAEFAADDAARQLSGNGLGLARSLTTLASLLGSDPAIDQHRADCAIATAGLSTFRSQLGRRVELLLSSPTSRRVAVVPAIFSLVSVLLTALVLTPRDSSVAMADEKETIKSEVPSEKETVQAPANEPAQEPAKEVAEKPDAAKPKKVESQPVPDGFEGFRGQLSGLVVAKNDDAGSFQLEVLEVQRVWKRNTAKHPEQVIGRVITIENLTGKWLDVLLSVKPGDAVEIETKHVRGPNAEFLGESFKKVALADILERVKKAQAIAPAAMEDQPKKDAPKDSPKDSQTDAPKPFQSDSDKPAESSDPAVFPEGLRGFRGIMIGRVISVDAEQGVLIFEGIEIKRTWPKNTAKNPASLRGKRLEVVGISGKWLDVLLTFKKGDVIEVEAFHNRGEKLDFVQEWLKKI